MIGAAPVADAQATADALAAEVLRLALASGRTVAVAESLTAGLVAGTLAGVPGISAVLRGGVVAYATELKASLLGVDPALLAAGGAVQARSPWPWPRGWRLAWVPTSASPRPASPGPTRRTGSPPGTVFVAVHGARGGRVEGREGPGALGGDRAQVRWASVVLALELLVETLQPR